MKQQEVYEQAKKRLSEMVAEIKKRIEKVNRNQTDILISATQATETRTRTGEINNQATIIRNNQRQMVQDIETEIDNSQEK